MISLYAVTFLKCKKLFKQPYAACLSFASLSCWITLNV